MTRFWRAACAAMTLGLLANGIALAQSTTQDIDSFFARYTDEWVRGNPDLATSLRYFSGLGCAELAQQYHQHTEAVLDGIVLRRLFDPRRLSVRCLRALRWRQPHFPWLCIRKRDNLALAAA